MQKQKIINNLEKFNYKYYTSKNSINIQLTRSLLVSIKIKDNKILIANEFHKWNILNGFLKLSLKQTFSYYSILSILVIFFIYINWLFLKITLKIDFYALIIVTLLYAFFVFIYYYIKYINFKQLIEVWLNDC